MGTLLLMCVLSGVISGCVYSIIAIGFVLIRKTSGVFNLAQGQIVLFGCYVFYSFAVAMGCSLWAAIFLTMVSGALMGIIIERFLMRPLYGQHLMAAVLITLALAVLLENIMAMVWGVEFLVAPKIFPNKTALELYGNRISYDHLAIMVFTVIIFSIVTLFFRKARVGVAMMSISDDQMTSQSLGIKVGRLVAFSWIITFVLAYTGGILITNISGISYTMAEIGIKSIAVAIIGGLESFGGLLLAGILVGLFESFGVGFLDPYLPGGSIREIMAYLLMMIILLIKPYGLFGWERIERV